MRRPSKKLDAPKMRDILFRALEQWDIPQVQLEWLRKLNKEELRQCWRVLQRAVEYGRGLHAARVDIEDDTRDTLIDEMSERIAALEAAESGEGEP